MPKNPAYNPSLNLIKGEPDKKKIKRTTIDRAKYKDVLAKPFDTMLSDNTESFIPEVMGNQGYGYESGTIKGKDLVYKKDNNYYLYNEAADGSGKMSYGFTNIGDLSAPASNQTVTPRTTITPTVTPAPTVKQMPIDPMKVEGFNGMLKTDVQQFKKGGTVKGYFNGTTPAGIQYMDTPDPTMDTNVTGYQANMNKVNAQNAAKQQQKIDKANRNAQIKQGADTAALALVSALRLGAFLAPVAIAN